MFFIDLFVFILGLILGSFFNVVGLRVPKKQSIIYPGSHCTSCQKTLNWYELIPVISYIALKGKCRNCSVKISIIYPLFELATGILFLLSFLHFGWQIETLIGWALISLIIIIFISDIHYMIIPDKVLLFFLPVFILLRVFDPLSPWWDSLLGAFIGFGTLLLIAIISKGAMGGGDIKLFFVLGYLLGLKAIILTFALASLIGAVFGISMMSMKRYGKRQPIPFGPFIGIGSILAFFYTQEIIDWYFNTFFW
ncbi:type 4 prepilin peptidase 1 [Falsibacillus pallidus]|uniref:Type 4 prepilin peptidase 1 n=1 Tax=Falsibacillus pallidus TaxID=493781 RepID=A0A370GLL7_9BACI|nr:type 4 prepilin peptidase 1 [Falsibacillus pallidus]